MTDANDNMTLSASLRGAIDMCRGALEHGFAYADMEGLLAHAMPWLPSAGHAELALLIGAVLKRSGEWDEASSFLVHQADRFDLVPDLKYEAALVSIDAGRHDRARMLFSALAAQLDQLSPRQLRGIWRGASMVGQFDIALAAITAPAGRSGFSISPQLIDRIRTAAEVQQSLDQPTIKVVSIGDNCLPWMVANRWGLRADPGADHEQSVFNLAQCAPETPSNLFASGLQSLLDPTQLATFPTDIGTPLPYHVSSGFQFNHEQGTAWCANDYQALRSKYDGAISNLNDAFVGRARIFVHYREKSGDMNRLIATLAALNKDQNYRILIIDPHRDTTEPVSQPHATMKRIALPAAEYVWFKPEDYESIPGIEFERQIATAILNEMAILRG
ncbi:hypothetical protein [Sphingomonas prati]|uniref:Uncharacterized protein n=1 Tax=Sphingomonas prati TaxID=1843237 RepID=A0A7W9F022_9SPHN|nr:hypothetical protein [Sphingomonas prati]MBB5727937.1 hypothetical protein [Sphingomonas prati]GGE81997.1 hypothetical protein GCM10011404_13300 [Sphingomonas prati]